MHQRGRYEYKYVEHDIHRRKGGHRVAASTRPPHAARYIQGSSPSAPQATLGSVPCACVPVCSLYMNRLWIVLSPHRLVWPSDLELPRSLELGGDGVWIGGVNGRCEWAVWIVLSPHRLAWPEAPEPPLLLLTNPVHANWVGTVYEWAVWMGGVNGQCG